MSKTAGRAAAPGSHVYRNRIIGHAEVDPTQLLANPANWRIHPHEQELALAGVLSEVGWVQEVVVNQRSGFVVDGHLRVAHAISRGEATVPVIYVDLDAAEEAKVLATLDPLAGMAGRDDEQLRALLADVTTDDAALLALLADMAGTEASGIPPAVDAPDPVYVSRFAVSVLCDGEDDQRRVFETLTAQGYRCKVLVV